MLRQGSRGCNGGLVMMHRDCAVGVDAHSSSGPTSPRFSCHSRIRAFSSCPMRRDRFWPVNLIELIQSVKCTLAASVQ
jgi:hypothetical protein